MNSWLALFFLFWFGVEQNVEDPDEKQKQSLSTGSLDPAQGRYVSRDLA
jgi:hypothetical protein